MKKLFIGLLIIAAGAGVYYYLQTQKKSAGQKSSQQELLVGKWKLDSRSTQPGDSAGTKVPVAANDLHLARPNSHFDFQKNGMLLQQQADSIAVDTSWFEWRPVNKILIKEAAKDSTGSMYEVALLDSSRLLLLSTDSIRTSFSRLP